MRNAHTVAAVRTAEQALMAKLPEGALMQRAAAGLASVCASLLAQVYGSRVVVLAGSGDNGGDALYAGARLAARGANVVAIAAGSRLHERGLEALLARGGWVVAAAEGAASDTEAGRITAQARSAIAAAALIIDGLTGIGGQGGLRQPAAELASLAEQSRTDGAVVVAVDLPSGIDADTGEVHGAAVEADVTVTFGTWKPGLLIDPGASQAGAAELIDIGLGPYLPEPAVIAMQAADVAAILPHPSAESDKYRRGVLGVLAGSEQYTGAAVLSVGGAIRGGAGMVVLLLVRRKARHPAGSQAALAGSRAVAGGRKPATGRAANGRPGAGLDRRAGHGHWSRSPRDARRGAGDQPASACGRGRSNGPRRAS